MLARTTVNKTAQEEIGYEINDFRYVICGLPQDIGANNMVSLCASFTTSM
jgi:hypothetical protein